MKKAGSCRISYPIFAIIADKVVWIQVAAKRILLFRVAWGAGLIKERLEPLFAFLRGSCPSSTEHVFYLVDDFLGVLPLHSEAQNSQC